MVKNIFIIIFVLAVGSVKAQFTVNVQWQNNKPDNTGDTISYDAGKKLKWNDFKGMPDATSRAAAITESGFGYRMSMNSYNNRMIVNITVFCYFSKNKSWVKKGMKTDYALLHEQHHFDITYINTCLFVKKLMEAKLNRSNYNSLVEQIHDACFNALSKMQNDYDGETSNGRIEQVQMLWNKKIDQQLAALITN
jgi:hypothetical protein